ALVLELADRALGVDHPPSVRLDPGRALAARPGRERLALRLGRLLAGFRQHRRLRRDEGGEPAPLGRPPDALGGEAGVGCDRFELGQGEASPVERRLDGVALEAVGLLAQAGDDAAVLAVDRHLATVNEVRTLTRLAAQLRLRVGNG